MGVAGLPTYNRGVADHQYLFVNGRPVKDRLLLGAVRGAYADMLARDRHAVLALFLRFPPRKSTSTSIRPRPKCASATGAGARDDRHRPAPGALHRRSPLCPGARCRRDARLAGRTGCACPLFTPPPRPNRRQAVSSAPTSRPRERGRTGLARL
jgi:DNA mismatch repair protein MutL